MAIPTLEVCRDILRAGHHWWSDEPRWSLMLHMLYGDLSGKAPLTSGCYLGMEEQWTHAIARWIEALKDADADYFHATDFYAAQGEFDSDRWRRWDEETQRMVPGGPEHDAFAARFANIPRRAGLIGFAFSLDASSFKEFVLPELRKERRKFQLTNERTYAIMNNIARVSAFLGNTTYRERGKIQIIFEHETRSGKYRDFFEESRRREEQWTYFYRSFNPDGPKDFPPIQMADLAAHEGWRRTKEVWSGVPRKLRESFKAMLGEGNFELQTHGIEAAQKNAEMIRDLTEWFPDGLIPPEYRRPVQ